MTQEITLTDDQQAALDSFVQFLMAPVSVEPVWVLKGYSGTGKSTLVHTLLDRLPGYIKAAELLSPDFPDYTVQLTATTNKAAETFSQITGMDVKTIHSHLGLRIDTDPRTGFKTLVANSRSHLKFNELLFIDEGSMVDSKLLSLIFQQTRDCKIVFIGDPAQLPPVKSQNTPVFQAGFPEAILTQVMRQMVDGKPCVNPITELATAFRHTVETGVWPTGFKPDGKFVKWVTRPEFGKLIEAEFIRPDWKYLDSKILAWTNNTVIQYNQYVRQLLKGEPLLQPGDYAENNSFVMHNKSSLKTDQTVYIADIDEECEEDGVIGNWVTLEHTNGQRWFHPKSREAKNKALLHARAIEDWAMARRVEGWVDLRAVFAQTVNKSQGSTYGKVFIDLDDIAKCNMANLIARMLYVAISRAQFEVVLAGDLV